MCVDPPGNIEADAEGKAEFHLEDRNVKLIGPHSVIGRSVVVKAGEDDLGRVSRLGLEEEEEGEVAEGKMGWRRLV